MTARHIARRITLAAFVAAVALAAPPARAETASTPQECYKSIRRCQKSRCAPSDGADQVNCMRQCNREYETCVSGAGGSGSGGGIFKLPDSLNTPAAPKRKRDVHRQQDQAE